jgi:hypothetical protein
MTDVVALKTIMYAQKTSKHITLVNLKKIGLPANDFKVPATCDDLVPGSKDALTEIFKIAAKTFDASANSATTQAQTRAIWADLGLDASAKDDKLKGVPDVGDKYGVAIQKHRDFVPGTRQWVFLNLYSTSVEEEYGTCGYNHPHDQYNQACKVNTFLQ